MGFEDRLHKRLRNRWTTPQPDLVSQLWRSDLTETLSAREVHEGLKHTVQALSKAALDNEIKLQNRKLVEVARKLTNEANRHNGPGLQQQGGS